MIRYYGERPAKPDFLELTEVGYTKEFFDDCTICMKDEPPTSYKVWCVDPYNLAVDDIIAILKDREMPSQAYVLEGFPGAGKTTLTKILSSTPGAFVVKEYIDYLPNGKEYLGKYLSQEMSVVDFQVGVVLRSFIEQILSPEFRKAKFIIFDREPLSITNLFLHMAPGPYDADLIKKCVNNVEKIISSIFPNTVIFKSALSDPLSRNTRFYMFLDVPYEEIRRRLTKRGNKCELSAYTQQYYDTFTSLLNDYRESIIDQTKSKNQKKTKND